MAKLTYLIFAVFFALGGYLLSGVVLADHVPLNNGDFETGNLAGWTVFTTPNGTVGTDYPQVLSFDINNDGNATYSAQFKVGQVRSSDGTYAGGGLFQDVHLVEGDYNLSVDIAADDGGSLFGNDEAGLFELMVDGIVVDSHNFGTIGGNSTKHSLLASVTIMTTGSHEIRVRITRAAVEPSIPLTQLVDNVVLDLIATAEPASDPAPAAVEPFPGGGQSKEVDLFLAYRNPQERTTDLAGPTRYEVKIMYGETINEGTFRATLNKQPVSGFNPVAGTEETVLIDLPSGRNVLSLSVKGAKADGKPADDKDTLTFLVP